MNPLQLETKRMVVICAGCGQKGKSTFSLRWAINGDFSCRFIFDPEGEASTRLGIPAAGDAYELSLALIRQWVIFDPNVMFPGRHDEAFAFFCEWVFEMASRLPGQKLMMVDEVWKYISTQKVPPELATCVQTGRKRGLAIIFNTQLPNKLHLALRNECSELVCFRLQDSAVLDYPLERGFNPEELRSLPDLHFISRSEKSGELRGELTL
jgi:hypothetical protein